ncbi:hypothetical protein LCGC14_1410720 [marine sediment metagenome]|uniref:Uncharacterized protein n=1 Tax=marine sediment metagenome TaxID=412755 RepID=A0A0F9MW17_9ZZZZ
MSKTKNKEYFQQKIRKWLISKNTTKKDIEQVCEFIKNKSLTTKQIDDLILATKKAVQDSQNIIQEYPYPSKYTKYTTKFPINYTLDNDLDIIIPEDIGSNSGYVNDLGNITPGSSLDIMLSTPTKSEIILKDIGPISGDAIEPLEIPQYDPNLAAFKGREYSQEQKDDNLIPEFDLLKDIEQVQEYPSLPESSECDLRNLPKDWPGQDFNNE